MNVKKRILSLLIVFALCLGLVSTAAFAQGIQAQRTAATVLVNGKAVAFDAYGINGNNYFKLRDIAQVLNGTPKQVEIGYDEATAAVSITSGTAYTAVGGELAPPQGEAVQSATLSTSQFICDDVGVELTAYLIGGNNYIKLRDLGAVIGFGVEWDGQSQTISILTDRGYTPEEQGETVAPEPDEIETVRSLEQVAMYRKIIGSWVIGVVIGYSAIDKTVIETISIVETKVDGKPVEFLGADLKGPTEIDVGDLPEVVGEGALYALEIPGDYTEGSVYQIEVEVIVTYTDGQMLRLIDTFTWNFDGSGGSSLY